MRSPNITRGVGWSVGFVEFYEVEQATLAKTILSHKEVDYGVRLTITYARQQKPPTELAGQYGNDHGGEAFAFGTKDQPHAERQSGRDRFSYEKANWQNRSSPRDRPRF